MWIFILGRIEFLVSTDMSPCRRRILPLLQEHRCSRGTIRDPDQHGAGALRTNNSDRIEIIAVGAFGWYSCHPMKTLVCILLHALRPCFRTRLEMQAENLALHHQIIVLQRGRKRLALNAVDRFLWVCLSRLWAGWRSALAIFKPETVIRWHRTGFRLYWWWKSRGLRLGRPQVPRDVQDLIRKMSLANSLWRAPRIHGELLKLGIPLSQATVAKYMVHTRKPPSLTWRAFLNNHATQLVSTDFFAVPTVPFRVLFLLVVLAHHRRRVVHFNVTAHPSSEWTARQIAEAFPWDSTPRYLLRNRDSI